MRAIVIDDNIYSAVFELRVVTLQDISDILGIMQSDIVIINSDKYRENPTGLIEAINNQIQSGDIMICDMRDIPWKALVDEALNGNVQFVILWSVLSKDESFPQRVFGIDISKNTSEEIKKGFRLIKAILDGSYEAVYDILSAFLPLDIELQVENNRERCRKETERLLEQKDTINLDRIETLIAEQQSKLPENIDETFNSAKTAFSGLFEQVDTIKAKLSNGAFERVRKQVFDSFHEGYTQLRDKLLEVVYAFEGEKS